MSLQIGQRLGSYEITAPLGKGGMGEVYRARDTKLKREVAIKILPDEFSRHPARVSRFQREAEVLASLNHPNIAHIYGVEECALPMEQRTDSCNDSFQRHYVGPEISGSRRARSLPERLSLAAMNWMQLAIELTREAMKSSAEPVKPTEPTDFGTALSQQFGLIDRQMDAIVQNAKAHDAELERSIRRQRIWNYTLAVAVVAVAVIAFLR
jgi:Protein kinase domain